MTMSWEERQERIEHIDSVIEVFGDQEPERKHGPKRRMKGSINMRVSEELSSALEKLAASIKWSKSRLIRRVLQDFLHGELTGKVAQLYGENADERRRERGG